SLALLGLMLFFVEARGEVPARPPAKKPLGYSVEVTVLEVNERDKKTALDHRLLSVPLKDGAPYEDKSTDREFWLPVDQIILGWSRIETGKNSVHYEKFGIHVACSLSPWDKDRLVLRAYVCGETYEHGAWVSRSKLVRPGRAASIVLEIPRGDLIP